VLLPTPKGGVLPKFPATGLERREDFLKIPGAKLMDKQVQSLIDPTHYSYVVQTTRRNLYRIPIQ
jgi:hypothetical protein